jgi:hypothetical protein
MARLTGGFNMFQPLERFQSEVPQGETWWNHGEAGVTTMLINHM